MKIVLSILTLGLSVWALPALATPSHPTHSRSKSENSASRSVKDVAVDLRIDVKDKTTLEHGNSGKAMRYERAQDGRDWKSPWNARPIPAGSGTFVPEPSAITLFAVGVVLALQAIPRRSPRADSTGGSGGATQHG